MVSFLKLPVGRCLSGIALLTVSTGALAADDFAVEIAPSQFDERCLRIEAGQAIRWRFISTGTVDFNIHHHRGSEVFYPVKRNRVERASGSFRSRTVEDYCLMWTNPGAEAVDVRGSVERY